MLKQELRLGSMSKRKASRSPECVHRPAKAERLTTNASTPSTSSRPPFSHTTLSYPSTKPSQPVKPVPFQQPTGLLTFSYTSQRVLEFTDSALRYYVDPPPGADLRYGYERWIKRPEERTRLDGLLRAVERVMQRADASTGPGSGAKWLRDIAVVTWRGIMTKILTAPYEDRDRFELNAMYVNGTLYMEEHLSDARLREKEDLAPKQRLQTYYGYSFESWCTSSSPGIPERLDGHPVGWGGDVDTNVQWCSVIKTKLGDSRLVVGGEVDCVRERFNGKMDTFVELKTSMSIRNAGDEARFEKKLLKFYMQSFLLGVPEIVVGFRTPAGRLTTTQTFKTIQIPRLVRGKPGAWDPQVCFSWGQEFLTTLNSILSAPAEAAKDGDNDGSEASSEPEAQVWRIVFVPGEGVKVSLLDEAGVRDVEGGDERVGILPRWYYDRIADKDPGPPSSVDTSSVPPPTTNVTLPSATTSSFQGWHI
ncbi:RAI1-domain-containing protein [Trametes punicea]|nr:RAI1-domain-containing protein [Trametes punicea]